MINSSVLYRLSVQHAHILGPWQAILGAVKSHHKQWSARNVAAAAAAAVPTVEGKAKRQAPPISPPPVFRVLDLASGPRGEPGTTIAHALPLALVHCTDACALAVADIPITAVVAATVGTAAAKDTSTNMKLPLVAVLPLVEGPVPAPVVAVVAPPIDVVDANTEMIAATPLPPIPLPPKNLTKSVQDLTNLSTYPSNTMDAIVCCYGYGLSSDLPQALAEAHRVLVPGGILVIATWEQSAMLSIGRDVLAFVRSGGRGCCPEEAWFLPPIIEPVGTIELSGIGELEALLLTAGFADDPPSEMDSAGDDVATGAAVITTRGMSYPYDLGSTPLDQFAMGTVLIREELESLGALRQESSGTVSSGVDAGGWNSLAEEGFWMNIRKYIDTTATEEPSSPATKKGASNMLLKDNIFKLTVSKKSHIVTAS